MISLHKILSEIIKTTSGWCSLEKAVWLADTVLSIKPSLCVEIGVYGGRSLLAMALAVKENGKGQVVGIDSFSFEAQAEWPYQNEHTKWSETVNWEETYRRCRTMIVKYAPACTSLIRATSVQAHEWFPCLDKIDLLHIDGCHSEISSRRDVSLWLPRVISGGTVVLDDTDWPSVQEAKSRIVSECELIHVGERGSWEAYRKIKA